MRPWAMSPVSSGCRAAGLAGIAANPAASRPQVAAIFEKVSLKNLVTFDRFSRHFVDTNHELVDLDSNRLVAGLR